MKTNATTTNDIDQRSSIVLFAAAKITGFFGILLGFTSHRYIAGGLLIAAGCFLACVVALAVKHWNYLNSHSEDIV